MTENSTNTPNPLETLKKRRDFLALNRTGRKWVTPGFILQADPATDDGAARQDIQVGYTVTRKVGNAVVRNRCKRRLREVVRAVMPSGAPTGWRYVLIGRNVTASYPFEKMVNDLKWAIRKLESGADLKNQGKNTRKPR